LPPPLLPSPRCAPRRGAAQGRTGAPGRGGSRAADRRPPLGKNRTGRIGSDRTIEPSTEDHRKAFFRSKAFCADLAHSPIPEKTRVMFDHISREKKTGALGRQNRRRRPAAAGVSCVWSGVVPGGPLASGAVAGGGGRISPQFLTTVGTVIFSVRRVLKEWLHLGART